MNTFRQSLRTFLTKLGFVSIIAIIVAGTASVGTARFDPHVKEKPRTARDVEIRLEFNPTGAFADLTEYYSVFIVIKKNGDARALRYGLHYQTKNIAAYEGVLPEAEIKRLFARVRAAFRLPKYRREYDRHRVYHGDGFYLALMSTRITSRRCWAISKQGRKMYAVSFPRWANCGRN